MRTGVKIQRAMFLESLWRQMDKMSASTGRNNMAKLAADYFSEGYEEHEVVELLVDEGFDAVAAKACVAMVAGDVAEDGDNKWGFDVEDQRGDIANNFDLGLDGVPGNDEDSAWEQAQELVDANHPGQYTVTRVFLR
jgi:hypothetical protein